MKKKITILGLGIVIILSLFVVLGHRRSNGKTASREGPVERVSSSSVKANHKVKSKKQKPKSSVKPKAVSSSTPETEKKVEQVFDQPVALEKGNDAALTQAINQQMASVVRSSHGPARWTAYVEELGGQQKKTSITNWQPADAQYSASTIKLFILIRYYQLCQDGRLNPSKIYTLRKSDVVQGSGTMLNDQIGTQYTLEDLCHLMIEQSDNIATNVLIDQVGGFSAVNQTIAGIVGKNHQSSLERKMMDVSNIENGRANRINAKEAAQTLLKLYQGKIVNQEVDSEMLSLMLKTKNRTKLPAQLPAGAICYNKSGESNYRGIENDMALIKYNGHVFALCILIEMDGDGETPVDATIEQTQSEVSTIANIGQAVTNVMTDNQ